MERRLACGVVIWLVVLAHQAAAPLFAQSTSVRIYLARHGQTDWNAEHRLQGGSDIPLNEVGRQQANRLRQRLNGIQFDAVYSSALRRSRETAEIVHGSVAVTVLPGLNERRLGVFEGRRTDPTDPVTAREYDRRSQDPDDSLEGGETLTQFFGRVQATLARIITRHHTGAILIVGHGGTNQMLVRALFGLSQEQAHAFEQANDDIYFCEIRKGQARHFWKLIDLQPPR